MCDCALGTSWVSLRGLSVCNLSQFHPLRILLLLLSLHGVETRCKWIVADELRFLIVGVLLENCLQNS